MSSKIARLQKLGRSLLKTLATAHRLQPVQNQIQLTTARHRAYAFSIFLFLVREVQSFRKWTIFIIIWQHIYTTVLSCVQKNCLHVLLLILLI